jgi:hypothetical protein
VSIFKFCSLGFDVTDESYYLLKIFNPADDLARITSFGRYLSILNLNNTVYSLRILGVLILVLVSSFTSLIFVNYLKRELRIDINKMEMVSLFSFLLISSTSFYSQYFLLTPSYNWLSLIGAVILVGASIKLIGEEKKDFFFLCDISFLAFGILLMFAGRPPGAVIAFVFSSVYVIFQIRPAKRLLFFSLLVFILLILFSKFKFKKTLLSFLAISLCTSFLLKAPVFEKHPGVEITR